MRGYGLGPLRRIIARNGRALTLECGHIIRGKLSPLNMLKVKTTGCWRCMAESMGLEPVEVADA